MLLSPSPFLLHRSGSTEARLHLHAWSPLSWFFWEWPAGRQAPPPLTWSRLHLLPPLGAGVHLVHLVPPWGLLRCVLCGHVDFHALCGWRPGDWWLRDGGNRPTNRVLKGFCMSPNGLHPLPMGLLRLVAKQGELFGNRSRVGGFLLQLGAEVIVVGRE